MSRLLYDLSIARVLADPEERAFIPQLERESTAAQARAAYAALLLRRNDRRGEFLDLVLRSGAGSPLSPVERARLSAFMREAAQREAPSWWHLVRPTAYTLGCGELRDQPAVVRFSFECPRLWESFAPTDDPAVRHCDTCREQVFRCETLALAGEHARAGHCIAVPTELAGQMSQEVGRFIIGRPHIPTMWAERVLGKSK